MRLKKHIDIKFKVRNNFWKFLIFIVALVAIVIFICICGEKEKSEKAFFENDTVSIVSVSTDEYLEVFRTKDIKFAYFASDPYPVIALDLGGATITITKGDKLYGGLETAVLTVYEDNRKVIITNMLEEFYICSTEEGYKVYYEIYNEYAEKVDSETLTKYINLKAYRIDFKKYLEDIEEQLSEYI